MKAIYIMKIMVMIVMMLMIMMNITASHWVVVPKAPGWVSSLQVAVLPGAHDGDEDDYVDDGDDDDKNYADPLPTRILGPILVSYVYEVKGTYWLFGLCAASLLVTGIVTLAAFRCMLFISSNPKLLS